MAARLRSIERNLGRLFERKPKTERHIDEKFRSDVRLTLTFVRRAWMQAENLQADIEADITGKRTRARKSAKLNQ
jgi:hypothetical protein